MTELTLEALGLTEEKLADRLVEKLADHMLSSLQYDEDGGEWNGESRFAKRLSDQVAARLNKIVDDLGEKHVLPRVTAMVEDLCLQETNKWGEKVGKPVTFTEYLVQRADFWLREEVDYSGKTKAEVGGYSFSKSGTRVSYMINQHLQHSISTAMKKALEEANKSIIGGLEEAVKIKLGQIAVQLKTEIKTK